VRCDVTTVLWYQLAGWFAFPVPSEILRNKYVTL
jgi:hypothetical protein